MSKIFEHADDLHVVAREVYKKANDVYAYSDSAKTKKIAGTVLADMFIKGCVIIDGTTKYKPVSMAVADSVVTITYVTTDTTTATTAVLATLNSSEYTTE